MAEDEEDQVANLKNEVLNLTRERDKIQDKMDALAKKLLSNSYTLEQLQKDIRKSEDEKKEDERKARTDAIQNGIVGFVLSFILALASIIMFRDCFEEAYTYGRWAAYSVFIIVSIGVFCIMLFFCLAKDPRTVHTHRSRRRRNCFSVCTFCFLVFASLALSQFQLYLGMVAWAYPHLVEPKALMKTDFAYNGTIRDFQPDQVAEDIDWTYERMVVNRTTFVSEYVMQDHILPSAEHIGLFAHCIPIVGALVFQFGAGRELASLAGVIMDFVDVQDFYLLLLENDIVVSYWSSDSNLGTADVTLPNEEIYTFKSTQKRFEVWVAHALNNKWYWFLNWWLSVDLEGSFYNYSIWKHIMRAYIVASCYVTLFPFFNLSWGGAFFVNEDSSGYKGSERACIGAVQTGLSLACVEIPFLVYRFAASQYYGIVMSSLFIKNVVSIIIDILKLCVYFFGLDISTRKVIAMRENRSCAYRIKVVLHKCLAFGSFIGEDFDEDTANTDALCPCEFCSCLEDYKNLGAESELTMTVTPKTGALFNATIENIT